MTTLRVVLVGALAMFVGALWLAGCAHHPTVTVASVDQVRITVHPWKKSPSDVRLVGKAPDAEHYRFVGRVAGRAPSSDFVEGAKDAEAALKQQAADLGADLVKIDRLKPSRRVVLVGGRAYKAIAN